MSQMLWVTLTWVAGTAAILGSFMALGSFILLLVPVPPRSPKLGTQSSLAAPRWQYQFRLLAFSMAIALAGLGILVVLPFPSF